MSNCQHHTCRYRKWEEETGFVDFPNPKLSKPPKMLTKSPVNPNASMSGPVSFPNSSQGGHLLPQAQYGVNNSVAGNSRPNSAHISPAHISPAHISPAHISHAHSAFSPIMSAQTHESLAYASNDYAERPGHAFAGNETNPAFSAPSTSQAFANPTSSSHAYSNPTTSSSHAYSNPTSSSHAYSNPTTPSHAYSSPAPSGHAYPSPLQSGPAPLGTNSVSMQMLDTENGGGGATQQQPSKPRLKLSDHNFLHLLAIFVGCMSFNMTSAFTSGALGHRLGECIVFFDIY
jgi:hypothetical protein